MNKPCEYCGCDLPLGVDKKTRQHRSHHFATCKARPVCEVEPPAQQEPVATLWQHGRTGRTRITMPGDITDCDADWFKAADLYTSPPAGRTWIGLTDVQIGQVLDDPNIAEAHQGHWRVLPFAFARAIEAKLKEKNT